MSAATSNSLLSHPESVIVGLDGVGIDESASSNSSHGARPPMPRFRLHYLAGALFLLVGLAAIGYGVFQLVVTDIIASRAQTQLSADFDSRVESAAAVDTTLSREQMITVFEAADDPTFETSISGGSFDNPADIPIVSDPTAVPLEPILPPLESAWVYEAPPGQGEPLGRIVIPQADVDWVIVEGVTPNDLRQGPGHMPNTAVPGQYGNAVISGHRTTYGAPFFNLERLVAGDRFTVETVIGTHTYEVVETRIVPPTGVWVTSQWEGSWLTLTTCNPRYSARERLIVFSRLVDGPNASSSVGQFGTSYQVPVPPGA